MTAELRPVRVPLVIKLDDVKDSGAVRKEKERWRRQSEQGQQKYKKKKKGKKKEIENNHGR